MNSRERDMRIFALVILAAVMAAMVVFAARVEAADEYIPPYDGCHRVEVVPDTQPSGWAGCEVYGHGIASRWSGPGVARNDCEWPWTACVPIRITADETGRAVVVTPTMFCDCRVGLDWGETTRIVDLDPATVAALGLPMDNGLYPVTVEPVQGPAIVAPQVLPDTRTILTLPRAEEPQPGEVPVWIKLAVWLAVALLVVGAVALLWRERRP